MNKNLLNTLFLSFILISCASTKKEEDKFANYTPEKLYEEGMKKMKSESYKEAV